jgi:amino-acid N-acetyltransferase
MRGSAVLLRQPDVRLRPAAAADVRELERFISSYTPDGTLLPRSRGDLTRHLGGFILATREGSLVGCGALHPVERELGEIRTLAVEPRWRGSGVGGRLIETLMREARRRGLARVFCLTRRVEFFRRHGFENVAKERFPLKVWNDCRLCTRLSRCDETAMERTL